MDERTREQSTTDQRNQLDAEPVVISVRPKIQNLNFHLFARSVHPELFYGCNQREFERDNYRLKISITSTGHLITFQNHQHVLTEINAAANHPLPKLNVLLTHPLDSARREKLTYGEAIEYSCHSQMEGVNPKIFATIAAQLDQQANCEGLLHRFDAGSRCGIGAVSYINVQSFHAHVKIRTFHTFPDTCAVFKSETKFVVLNPVPIERS